MIVANKKSKKSQSSLTESTLCDWTSLHETPYGAVVGEWKGELLARLRIEWSREISSGGSKNKVSKSVSDRPSNSLQEHGEQEELLQQCLDDFFVNTPKPFPWKRMLLAHKTDFQLAVLKACYDIPPGKTLTYGEIASKVGSPGAARAVGQVMATNPLPLFIPCHRVLASSRKLCGFSAPGGIKTKAILLARESTEEHPLFV